MNTLQKKLNHAANSTNVTIDVTGMGYFTVIEAGHIIKARIVTYNTDVKHRHSLPKICFNLLCYFSHAGFYLVTSMWSAWSSEVGGV